MLGEYTPLSGWGTLPLSRHQGRESPKAYAAYTFDDLDPGEMVCGEERAMEQAQGYCDQGKIPIHYDPKRQNPDGRAKR